MALDELLSMKKTADKSELDNPVSPIDLSYFAMSLSEGETPVELYEAVISKVSGRILVTHERLVFIGKENGRRVTADFEMKDIENSYIEKSAKRGQRDLFIEVNSDGLYTFTMKGFNANKLNNYIGR